MSEGLNLLYPSIQNEEHDSKEEIKKKARRLLSLLRWASDKESRQYTTAILEELAKLCPESFDM